MVAEGVALKRRVLVDALTMCLERSRVCAVVDAQTIRSVLDSGMAEMWREGELRLEYVWKILCQQPGLSAKEVAPPLLAFKAYEEELGVSVRVPPALSSLPRPEQVKLRDELGLTREDFAKTLATLHELAAADQAQATARKTAERAAAKEQSTRAEDAKATTRLSTVAPPAPASRERGKRTLAIVLGATALVALPAALFLTFHDRVELLDTSDVGAHLRLSDARREGASMVARIADARWDAMSEADREQAAKQVFDVETRKGVQSMTLQDAIGRVRVVGTDVAGTRTVTVK